MPRPQRQTKACGIGWAIHGRELDRCGIGAVSDVVCMVLLRITCQGEELFGSIGGFQRALPFIRCSSCFPQPCPRGSEIHMLKNWLERKAFTAQYLLHLIPTLECGESINVSQIKILAR